MKWALLFVSGLAMAANADLAKVHNVYLLPMRSGMDQYLASALTRAAAFQVVTDPAKADAIFTDSVGDAFETKMKQLYPPPAPPKTDKSDDSQSYKGDVNPPASTFSRGRGNLFLVDVKSRKVIWSDYSEPRDARSRSLEELARKEIARLQKDMNPEAPKKKK